MVLDAPGHACTVMVRFPYALFVDVPDRSRADTSTTRAIGQAGRDALHTSAWRDYAECRLRGDIPPCSGVNVLCEAHVRHVYIDVTPDL